MRGVPDIEEAQRRFRRVGRRSRPPERAGQDDGQVSQVVDDVVVCPRLELGKRRSHVVPRDDHHRCAQPETPHVLDKRGVALMMGVEDERRDIGVGLDPAQGGRDSSGPRHCDIRCNSAQSVGGQLRRGAFGGDVEDFHGSGDRERSISAIGQTSPEMQYA